VLRQVYLMESKKTRGKPPYEESQEQLAGSRKMIGCLDEGLGEARIAEPMSRIIHDY
jgi:hypothetical protein